MRHWSKAFISLFSWSKSLSKCHCDVYKNTYLPSPLAFCPIGPADKKAAKVIREKQNQM